MVLCCSQRLSLSHSLSRTRVKLADFSDEAILYISCILWRRYAIRRSGESRFLACSLFLVWLLPRTLEIHRRSHGRLAVYMLGDRVQDVTKRDGMHARYVPSSFGGADGINKFFVATTREMKSLRRYWSCPVPPPMAHEDWNPRHRDDLTLLLAGGFEHNYEYGF